MSRNRFFLFLFSFVFFISLVVAIQITNFTNYSTSENLTFTGDSNFTRNISIYKNADVTSAYLNLSGYEFGSCYQESANISNQTGVDGSCNLNYTGTYSFNNNWVNTSKLIDGKWYDDSGWDGGVTLINHNLLGEFYINYTKPIESISSEIRFDGYGGGGNEIDREIPSDCFDYDNDTLLIRFSMNITRLIGYATLHVYCYNNSWKEIAELSLAVPMSLYEEAMIWKFTTIPANPYIQINNTQIWNHTGEFNSTFSPNQTSNFSSTLNTALNGGLCDCTGCSLDEDVCSIPFLFHSDTAGILEYSEMDINWVEYENPSVVLNSLQGVQFTTSLIVDVDATDDYLLDNCFYNVTYNSGSTTAKENTYFNTTTNPSQPMISSLGLEQVNTTYVITISCNDSFNNINESSFTFSIGDIYTTGGGEIPFTPFTPEESADILSMLDWWRLLMSGSGEDLAKQWNPSVYPRLQLSFSDLFAGGDIPETLGDLGNTFVLFLRYVFRQPASLGGVV